MKLGVKDRSVGLCANRHGHDDFAVLGIHHRHHFVMAADKQPKVCRIDRHTGGLMAGRHEPVFQDGQLPRIELRDNVFVLYIEETMALTVGFRRSGFLPRPTDPATLPSAPSTAVAPLVRLLNVKTDTRFNGDPDFSVLDNSSTHFVVLSETHIFSPTAVDYP